jgi:UrcA family protein
LGAFDPQKFRSKSMWRFFRALPIVVSFVFSTPLALAGRAPEHVVDVAVSYRNLDLRKQSDVSILLERIERAAVKACGGNPRHYFTYETMPKHTTAVFTQCRRDAVARAVSSINAPMLSWAFEHRTDPPLG